MRRKRAGLTKKQELYKSSDLIVDEYGCSTINLLVRARENAVGGPRRFLSFEERA
jgi:hypothetical protein